MKKLLFIYVLCMSVMQGYSQMILLKNTTLNDNSCLTATDVFIQIPNSWSTSRTSISLSLQEKRNGSFITVYRESLDSRTHFSRNNPIGFRNITRNLPLTGLTTNGEFKITIDGFRNRISRVRNSEEFDRCDIDVFFNDDDQDGVSNDVDNCPQTSNTNQNDRDNDGIGDSCDRQDNRDNDRDGVQNWQDDCPNDAGPRSNDGVIDADDDCTNEAGPSSNDGCPIPGEADLEIDEGRTLVSSDCNGCNPTLQFLRGDEHVLNNFASSFNITAVVINNGDAESEDMELEFYGSSDNKLDGFDRKWTSDISIDNLNPGRTDSGTAFITANEIIDSFSAGDYYLLFVIDGEVKYSLPFRYRNASSKSLGNSESGLSLNSELVTEKTEPYQLQIFDLNGRVILDQVVESAQEEESVKAQINSGFYISISDGEVSKFYKE